MATLTQQGREGYKLENVDSGNRLLPLFIRWTDGWPLAPRAGGGEDRKNLKCLGNSMHIVSGTEKRPIFARRLLLWTFLSPLVIIWQLHKEELLLPTTHSISYRQRRLCPEPRGGGRQTLDGPILCSATQPLTEFMMVEGRS